MRGVPSALRALLLGGDLRRRGAAHPLGMGRGRGDRTHDDQGRRGNLRPGRGYRSHGGRARRVGTEEFIACFPTTRSEIVVPIAGPDGVRGEIDIDSDWLDAFDDRDRTFLEDVAERLSRVMRGA